MHFKIILLMSILTFFTTPLFSAEAIAWSDWEQEYQSYCVKKDKGQFCDNLKNIDGSWVAPSEEVKKLLKELYPQIEKASKLFNVKKESIIAAIFAENSLNVSLNDDIQNWLVKKKVFSHAKLPFLGYFSIGFSQVTVSSALKVEEAAAKAEGRKVRTEAEIAQELLNPISAINYTAAIIKNNQNIYAKNGFDISNRPDILASLHSLGEPEKYALKAKAEGRIPKPNFMGIFASKYKSEILVLAKNNINPPVEKKSPITEIAPIKEPEPTKTTNTNKNQIPLLNSIPLCIKNGAGKAGNYNKILSYFEGDPKAGITATDTYSKISESIDCNLKEWSLVRTATGEEGWIKNDKLNSKNFIKLSSLKESSSKVCSAQKKCEAEIKKINPETISMKGRKIDLKVAYLTEYGQPDMSKYDSSACIAGWGRITPSKEDKGNVNQESLDRFSKHVQNFVRKLNSQLELKSSEEELKSLTIPSWASISNAFQIVNLQSLAVTVKESQRCIDAKIRCNFNFKKIEDELVKINTDKPELNEILQLASVVNFISPVNMLDKIKVELPANVKANIDFFLENCKIDPNYKKSQEFVKKIKAFKDNYNGQDLLDYYSDKKYWIERVDTCNYINFLDKKIDSIDVSSKFCQKNVNVAFKVDANLNGSRTSKPTIEISLLNKILSTISSKDDFLNATLEEGLYFERESEFPLNINCSFEPFKTSEMIKKINALKCVDKIYISDLWILKNLSKEVSNLYYLPSAHSNNFEVLLKDECK